MKDCYGGIGECYYGNNGDPVTHAATLEALIIRIWNQAKGFKECTLSLDSFMRFAKTTREESQEPIPDEETIPEDEPVKSPSYWCVIV
jgi:hypothetical protein